MDARQRRAIFSPAHSQAEQSQALLTNRLRGRSGPQRASSAGFASAGSALSLRSRMGNHGVHGQRFQRLFAVAQRSSRVARRIAPPRARRGGLTSRTPNALTRAHARADVLRRLGYTVQAGAAGHDILESTQNRTRELNVLVALDGNLDTDDDPTGRVICAPMPRADAAIGVTNAMRRRRSVTS